VFVRVHATELGKAARSSAALLAKGRGPDSRRLAGLAASVEADLDELSHSSSDRVRQRRLATLLERAATEASRLGKRL
jgi:hypothetical protein